MHVSGFPFDLYPFLQFIFTAFVIAIAILHLVKNTASKYFTVEANFEEGGGGTREIILRNRLKKNSNQMVAVATCGDSCAVCGKSGNKQCSRCKRVRYCSGTCQTKHWKEGHSRKCQELSLFGGLNSTLSVSSSGMKTSAASKSAKELPQLKKVLFPYEEFVKLFSWGKGGFPPCGLINCGNSCYANVVLQCLSCTRPLIAYLLEIGHEKKCRRNDWCFLCELEHHVERASHHSSRPFSPINILSRLPNIGGNLGYGKQEDAHEFMRFAIDTMQSVCLDEYGGEKAIHPDSQETTLIQYIFGGQLQSQVKCSKCNKISYRHENMMDLTVEIQGDAESLVECLDQFTAEECLDGDNMYKCDGCNDYVKACKRLAIHCAPNVLTIALKRFQSGRFGKLNKRVTFPETLDLGPYMSEPGHGTDLYRLYAVVVHIDMLNASYFGHYICYTKDFSGNWYRNDDCKITPVELEEVLSQGAYMLLYSRVSPRPCVKSLESREEKQQLIEEAQSSSQANFESVASEPSIGLPADLRSPAEEEKKQDLVAINEAKPSSGLPVVECIKVYGPLNSLSSTGTDVRSSTIESSSVKDDLVCMNIDNPNEVNSRFLENDTTCTAADVPVSPESRSLDMDLDGPTRFDPRGFQPGHEMSNLELGSFGMNMENYDNKHSDTNVRSSVEILRETSPLTEVHLDGEPSVMNSDDKSFEDDAGMGNQESVSNEVSADHDVPIQSESVGKFIHGTNSSSFHCLPHPMSEQLQPDTIPCSGLESAGTYIPRKNSSSFDCLPPSMSEQLQAVKPVNVTTAAQVLKRNSSKMVGEKSYSNGKQKPLFSRGFLDKQIRCKSPNMKGKVVIEPGEVDMPSKANGNCNGFSKPGVTSVVHDQNRTISPDGLHVPAYVNGRSEKCSNGVGPSNSLSSHEAEIVPVTSVHTFPVSAPSPGSFLPTEVHDFGHQRKSLEFNLNGNSDYNSASEQVGSLPIQMDQEMDVISSEVPVVVSSSDIEMLDETNVTSFRSERSPSLVHTTIESNGYVNAAQNIDLLSSNAQDGSLGFMEKQTEGNCQNNNDASDGQGEVGFSYKASYCNGSADPGSCFEDGRQVNNHDRKFECSSINTAAHKAGDHLPWIRCNGNGTHNDDDGNMACKKDQGGVMFCNNSENLLSPGSWKKSPMKGEEISSLNDIVSSNHDGNKLAGVV